MLVMLEFNTKQHVVLWICIRFGGLRFNSFCLWDVHFAGYVYYLLVFIKINFKTLVIIWFKWKHIFCVLKTNINQNSNQTHVQKWWYLKSMFLNRTCFSIWNILCLWNSSNLVYMFKENKQIYNKVLFCIDFNCFVKFLIHFEIIALHQWKNKCFVKYQ